MTTKIYTVIKNDVEFADVYIIGSYRLFDDAILAFQAQIGKELSFNIMNYCSKAADNERAKDIRTLNKDYSIIETRDGYGKPLDDIELETLTFDRFETSGKQFDFWIGDLICISIVENELNS